MRALAFAAVLAGCASTPYPAAWHRPGASQEDLRVESAQCRAQAISGSSSAASGFVAYSTAAGIFKNCMVGKGWFPGE